MLGIVDYGAGNLRSVQKALEAIGERALVSGEPAVLDGCDKLILPGVGSFGAGMAELSARGLDLYIKARAADTKILGICLGMQFLLEQSFEDGEFAGLGLIPGQVVRFTEGKIPQIGWNEVHGQVGIDMLAGPSEILIIADDQQNPKFVAADVLSQAEHDKLARALLLTPSRAFAEKVAAEVERQLALLPRREIAEYSVRNAGGIILVKDLDEACALANEIAPEHLELATENCEELLPKIRNAGAVFMGSWTSEPLGDYFAGPDHTLPTGGTARFFEVLNQDIFLRKMSVIQYTKKALLEDGEHVIRLAENEQLGAHANAVRVRLEEK